MNVTARRHLKIEAVGNVRLTLKVGSFTDTNNELCPLLAFMQICCQLANWQIPNCLIVVFECKSNSITVPGDKSGGTVQT